MEGCTGSGRLRNLYKTFLKQGILPSEVDKQDLDILLWVALSPDEQSAAEGALTTDGPIMGLL